MPSIEESNRASIEMATRGNKFEYSPSNQDMNDINFGRYLSNAHNVSDEVRNLWSIGRFGVTEIGQTGKIEKRDG